MTIEQTINILVKEVESKTKKISVLTDNLSKCKRDEDKIKLSVMIYSNVVYVANCVKFVADIKNKIIESFIESIPSKGRLFICNESEKMIDTKLLNS